MEVSPTFRKLKLRSAYGTYYRDVSNAPPRPCQTDEIPLIPLIDITEIDGSLEAKQKIAQQVAHASENMGSFYIKGDGLERTYSKALEQSK